MRGPLEGVPLPFPKTPSSEPWHLRCRTLVILGQSGEKAGACGRCANASASQDVVHLLFAVAKLSQNPIVLRPFGFGPEREQNPRIEENLRKNVERDGSDGDGS